MHRFLAAFAAVLLLAQCDSPAAPAPTGPDATLPAAASLASMQQAWASFEKDFAGGNYAKVVDVMPPRLLSVMARRAGQSPARLKADLGKTTAAVMSAATIHSYRATAPRSGVQSAGGLPFARFDTITDISVGSRRQTTRTRTVGVFDNGRWYFIRVADAGAESALREAYPQLNATSIR